ncbi:hypothetical protein V8E53_002102 [Lactarius tabidus]
MHGSMFVPIVAGSNKTTVSVTSGSQEYHPVYMHPSTAWCAGVVLVAFLLIPKPYMTKPKIMKCPEGHFCHMIFGLGLYIANYLEQVWLTGVVSKWCPNNQHSHEKTDLLIKTCDTFILWDDFLFKDHLMGWIIQYLYVTHDLKCALILAVPPIPDLFCFSDRHNFKQWTDCCKVCLAAIAGYVPSGMVHCVAAFLDTFYIAHQNTISLLSLNCLDDCIETFHQLCKIFVDAGSHITFSSMPTP